MLIKTERLELALQSPREVLDWVDTLPPEVRSEISPVWLNRLQAASEPDPWICMFRIRRNDNGCEVGSCGFKGAPDEKGVVEIAYGIEEAYQNQGFATESARALRDFAFEQAQVKIVRANTKKENVASECVLNKCEFRLIGQFEDPEDGLVNRWEICRVDN